MGGALFRGELVHISCWCAALTLEAMEAHEQVLSSRKRREVTRDQAQALRRIAQSERARWEQLHKESPDTRWNHLGLHPANPLDPDPEPPSK
jgi:hypothetical protein